MDCIEGVAVRRCLGSPYLRPYALHYRQNGVHKSWDFMKTHDRWSAASQNPWRSQPRMGLGAASRAARRVGVTLELCAGLVDQPGLSLEEVACKEALEECGYHLDPRDLRRVATCRAGVGLTGSSQTVFYAEVTDAQHSALGGGVAEEGEVIDIVHLPFDGAQAFANNPDIPKTLGVLFAISCFFSQIAPHLGPQRDPEVLPDLPTLHQ